MESLLELTPLVAFFAAFQMAGIYWATGVLMIACVALALAHRLRTGKFKDLHVITAVLVVVLGAATLLLHDKRFIQWKPTVLFALLSLALLLTTFIGKRPLIQRLLQAAIPEGLRVGQRAWRVINLLWAFWFAALAVLNLYVAWNFSDGVWVQFHTYGVSLANLVFMIPQVIWLSARAGAPAPPAGEP